MTLIEARKAIYDSIIAQWGDTTLISFDDIYFQPEHPDPYISISTQSIYQPNDSGFIGNKNWKMHGSILIQIFVDSGDDRDQLDTFAQQLVNILRAPISGITMLAPSAMTIPSQISSGWQQMNVIANFWYFDSI